METCPSSFSRSSLLLKSKVWLFLHKPPWTYLLFFTLFSIGMTATTSLSESYHKNCDHIIPSSIPNTILIDENYRSFRIARGSFTGGDQLFLGTNISGNEAANIARFSTHRVSKTQADGVFYLQSTLHLRSENSSSDITRRLLSQFHVRPPKIPVQSYGINFHLDGFWSSSLGKLCMVGSGYSNSEQGNLLLHQVILKLDYPNTTTIYTNLIHGVLESQDLGHSLNYFEPVSILGVSEKNYEYSLIGKESEDEWTMGTDNSNNISLDVNPKRDVCSQIIRLMDQFQLDYGNHECDNHTNCNPLGNGYDFSPKNMYFDNIQCSSNQRTHMLIMFSKKSDMSSWKPLDTQKMLLAEGIWDVNKNLLRIIACRVSYSGSSLSNASIEDCSIRLKLKFSPTLSLRNMEIVQGQVWSNKSENDKGYFAPIGFSSSKVKKLLALLNVSYNYTEIDNVKKICVENNKNKGSIYTNENLSDLSFGMSVKNSRGQKAQGNISPLFVNNFKFSRNFISEYIISPTNMSYYITFTPQPSFMLGQRTLLDNVVQIFAEGVYDAQTGILCMKGCLHLDPYDKTPSENNTLDCEILVKIRYGSLNSKKGSTTKGTIESTREKADPLYFDRLDLSSNSISARQAEESIWRMDLEIAMVLISNTIACVFVGLQLFYVRKHPDFLPFISIIMLLVLTLGYMIPLLLNFEALFLTSRNRQNLFLDNGGWLEVNEVIVRIVTMVAFLLQARLLQQTWSSRLSHENQKKLWSSDKKATFFILPLYIFGGFVAWFVSKSKISSHIHFLKGRNLLFITRFQPPKQNYIWGGFKSYGGLILDSFLLPQILFNALFNSKEKVLSPFFYIGTTFVRLLPHGYDLYRAQSSNWEFNTSYIYANPKMDLYSTAWDVIIPCCGLVFAVMVYLQQRFGGRFFLPKRFRESSEYEKVPVFTGEL